MEEFAKLFNLSDSFYFSFSGDLSNSLQRQMTLSAEDANLPLWKRFDDRFFFNKHLVKEIIDLNDSRADQFILPFIQGFVEMSSLKVPQDPDFDFRPETDGDLPDSYLIALISRRSRRRAGTRYKRRGADAEGNVANFVETEQIVLYHNYSLSFVLTRGSVPVFWSQPGLKYRPPPKLDRTEAEDKEAFKNHFKQELKIYDAPIVSISLIEKVGREKVISEAFLDRALDFDNSDLNLVVFDFHVRKQIQ